MLKTKYALSALGLLVAMTMATDALAQGVFTVSSSIEPRARMNGHTEEAGGITLFQTSGSVDVESDVTIDYGVAITNGVGVRESFSADAPANTIAVNICEVNGTGGNDWQHQRSTGSVI